MIIDIHSHCIPEAFRDWLQRHGVRVGAEVVSVPGGQAVQFRGGPVTGPQYGWDSMSDIPGRLAAMDRMGIDIQVLSGWIDLAGYEVAPASAAEYARAHNETLAETAASSQRFRALGTAPVQDPRSAVGALEHAMDELDMAGLQLATRVDDSYLDQQVGLDEFWEAAAEKQALLVLHPVRPLAGVDLKRYFLDNSVGRPAESSIALAGLILSGVFERHPELTVCVVHGGGFIPFQIGRLDQSFHQLPAVAGAQIAAAPSTYLDSVFVDTIVHDDAALRFLIDRLGSDQVLLGTDYPFPMGDQDPVSFIESVAGQGTRDARAILGANAADLLPH